MAAVTPAIVGAYEHPTRHAPDKSEWLLHAEAARGVLDDAGLKPGDIDAYFTSATVPEGGYLGVCAAIMMTDYLNLRPSFIDETDVGGASFGYYLNRAVLGIQQGIFKTALIAYGANTRSRAINVGTIGYNQLSQSAMRPTPDSFEEPYGLTVIGFMALLVKRYMHDYGLTSEQLASVAVTMREHAGNNPDAMKRERITVDDVLESGVIARPMHKLDCCIISDGAAAIIVAHPDVAKGCKKKPVFVLGYGESITQHEGGTGDWVEGTIGMVQRASDQAFGRAGVTRDDVDVALIYDAFTPNVILDLEGAGFCARGEAGEFVESGGLRMDGPLPTNPDGGGLSSNHPGRRGIFLLVEATRQLRGEADGRQVPDAKVAACTATGAAFLNRRGSAAHILGV